MKRPKDADFILKCSLPGTNISPTKALLKMTFLFPRWDMLVPKVHFDFESFLIILFLPSLTYMILIEPPHPNENR